MNREALFERLVNIMARLRSEEGCPWDREQTRESLKPYIIEEAYELIEAIENDDPQQIKEELGDLLFQIIFQCQIASEKGEFDIWDVLEAITEKMLNRHPHVFGQEHVKDSEEVLKRWEEYKRREGKLKESILEGIPSALPSLLRAHRVQQRASRVGFDWNRTEEVYEKLKEELGEFEDALHRGNREEIEAEMGDLLFSLVNVSRFAGVNPEDALRRTTDKFIDRFRYIEEETKKEGKNLHELSLSEMDSLWEKAKKIRRGESGG